jgi:hypothetical protein
MYPEEILPRRKFTEPHINTDSLFIREIAVPAESFLEDGEYTFEIIDEIVKPNGYSEIFSLSVFLKGVYTEKHVGIQPQDHSLFGYWDKVEELSGKEIAVIQNEKYPAYIRCTGLYDKTVADNSDIYHLFYKHRPTRCNFWHYEFYVLKNDENVPVPRKKGATRDRVAEKIAEDIVYFALSQNGRGLTR